jgi:hypothetical protein
MWRIEAWHPSSWPGTRHLTRGRYPKVDQMPPSKTSTNKPSREKIQQETATLDKTVTIL